MSYATQMCERGTQSYAPPTETRSRRPAKDDQAEWHAAVAALGPLPKPALQAFVDMGMSDSDIARYHRIPPALVSKMRRMWEVRCTW